MSFPGELLHIRGVMRTEGQHIAGAGEGQHIAGAEECTPTPHSDVRISDVQHSAVFISYRIG